PGAQGTMGKFGSPGADAASGYQQVSAGSTIDGNGNGSAHGTCPNGKLALSGGVESNTFAHPVGSFPTNDGTGWVVTMRGSAGGGFWAYAICVTATRGGVS